VLNGRYLLVDEGMSVTVGRMNVRVAVGDGKGVGEIVFVKVAGGGDGISVGDGRSPRLQETSNKESAKRWKA
jgi:hypothetical protein